MNEILKRYSKSKKDVTIPAGVTDIGDMAFSGCSSLSSITIPNSVTSIGSDVFQSCSNNLVIYGVVGSYAEKFANEQGIPFEAK